MGARPEMSEMDAAHARDYRNLRRYEDAARAIRAVIDDGDAWPELPRVTRELLIEAERRLHERCALIVRSWD